MFGWEVSFDNPWYLLLVPLIVPLLWWFSWGGLAGLGPVRWLLVNLFRTIVIVLLIAALAEIQLLRTSDRLTVLYVLDQSESIPLVQRQAMLDYTIQAVARHRRRQRQDRAGVIVFGANAVIEIPPFDEDIPLLEGVAGSVQLSTAATNLEGALKLAKATFPEDAAKRVVLVTDGNETTGDVRSLAATLAEDGIGLDVVPVKLAARAEVSVEKIVLPPEIRQGQVMETRVVLNNFSSQDVSGRVRITRRGADRSELLGEQSVTLHPGKNVYSFRHEIREEALHTYQADFIPADPASDQLAQNNRATAFTQVRRRGRVLLIEDWQAPGQFDHLVDRLRTNEIEVTVQRTDRLFANLAELQAYDAVILANTPRSSGDESQQHNFSDAQVEMLVRNTEHMGCGLILLGGPNSFGAGGWSNTPLEKAMPVDFQIDNEKIRRVGALALMMHASEMANGNYWQKQVAEQAIDALGPMDYCGLIHWVDGDNAWLWRDEADNGLVTVGERRKGMLRLLSGMTPGDMPEFDPGMKMALEEFNKVEAAAKLMIVISDGDPSPPSLSTLTAFRDAGIQVSTVAVGTHGPAGHTTLKRLATATGGRYYVVDDAQSLPKIYVNEVRRVARPLVFEPPQPVVPRVVYQHEILNGIAEPLPPLSGFVLTTVKRNPLAEVLLQSPLPDDPRNATILAAWTYGLGRTAILTTDSGHAWAARWRQWDNYDKLFTQLVRWAMRPVRNDDRFQITTDVREGRIHVTVTALDQNDEFLNFLDFTASVIDPQLQGHDVTIRQVAPGRYEGEWDADSEGNYFFAMRPGPGYPPLVAGVNVPYSAEYRRRETNMALLRSLANLRPQGGQPGKLIDGLSDPQNLAPLLETDTFRGGVPPAFHARDVWPQTLLIMVWALVIDVFLRRVAIRGTWLVAVMAWWRRITGQAEQAPDVEQRLAQLRDRKAAVTRQLEQRRQDVRFEPREGELNDDAPEEADTTKTMTDEPAAGTAPPTMAETEGESYTERLLRAKRDAQQRRQSSD